MQVPATSKIDPVCLFIFLSFLYYDSKYILIQSLTKQLDLVIRTAMSLFCLIVLKKLMQRNSLAAKECAKSKEEKRSKETSRCRDIYVVTI
jgi:hypothetical protein